MTEEQGAQLLLEVQKHSALMEAQGKLLGILATGTWALFWLLLVVVFVLWARARG